VERGRSAVTGTTAALARARAWSARNPSVADAALALGLWLLSVPVVASGAATTRDWLVATVLAIPLLWRRRAPLAVFCAVALIAFGQWLAGAALQVGDAAVLFALYAVVVYDRRRWAAPAAFAIGVLGALLATLRYTDGQELVAFLSMSAFVVAAAALGVWGRTRRDRIAELEERARRLERERDQQAELAAAAERARIARELHDVVAHSLTVMVALADGARLAAAQEPERADSAMRDVSQTGRDALREMRRLLGVLREQPAAPLAPQPGLGQLDALVEQVRATGLDVTVTRSGEPRPLTPSAELTVFRIVQEALTNTLKHAPAASGAAIRLDYGGAALALEVTDDGAPVAPPAGGEGRGLIGMRERLAAFGAEVEAGPLPRGGGWQVRTLLQLDGEDRR
jgi:signal transduction histidine kinase